MTDNFWADLVIAIVVIAVVALIVGYLLYWFYRRASQQTAFVRTGLGGRKVVTSGGALVIPIVHTVTPVNMNTLRLEVRRSRGEALITKNRMRVDVVAEFYVRVKASPDAIATAAQTLGSRTMQPQSLTELLDGKFVDALRRVAAESTMEELHEKRGDYARRVKASVGEDLLQNGLELETVSITNLDQTNMEFFNPSNTFDAEGLTRLTEEIERRRKVRNDIEQDTLIQIRNKNLEAEKESLAIDREAEYARLAQEREIEIARAAQRAELARERAQRDREAEEASILARQAVERSRIEAERLVDEARIAREREIQELEIERRKLLELAEQERSIALAQKSKEQSEKQAEADAARALAVAAEEKVYSAREMEIAERRKQIALLEAAERAEQEGIRIRSAAEADRAAAGNRADALRLVAEGEADAEKIRAIGFRIRGEVEAEAARLMNEAQNVLTPESRMSALRMHLVDKLEGIIRESVRPLEKIEGIRIVQLDGLNGVGGGDVQQGSVTDNVVNSALRYRAQAPLVDALMREIGIEGGDVHKFADKMMETKLREIGGKRQQIADQGSGD